MLHFITTMHGKIMLFLTGGSTSSTSFYKSKFNHLQHLKLDGVFISSGRRLNINVSRRDLVAVQLNVAA